MLDVLVNNAGTFSKDGTWDKDASPETISAALLEADDNHWAQVFAVNVASLQVRLDRLPLSVYRALS